MKHREIRSVEVFVDPREVLDNVKITSVIEHYGFKEVLSACEELESLGGIVEELDADTLLDNIGENKVRAWLLEVDEWKARERKNETTFS